MIAGDIREKMKDAMRAKDQVALDTYRGTLSAFQNELVANGKMPQDEVSDDMAQKVIARLVKQRKDAIAQFETGGRNDLADAEKAQLVLLETFLPVQIDDTLIQEIANRKKIELGITDKAKIGILTGAVMKEVAGQADGSRVKSIVESILS